MGAPPAITNDSDSGLIGRLLARVSNAAHIDTKAASATPPTYNSVVLADTPSLYYRFGESTGTVVTDSSGNSRNGTYSGDATLGRTGALAGSSNTAIKASGPNPVSYSGAGLPTGSSSVSADGWVKNATGDTRLVSYGGTYRFEVQVAYNNSRVVTVSNGPAQVAFAMPFDFADGNWHYWAVTATGASVSLYSDGSLVGTAALALSTDQLAGLRVAQFGNADFDELAIYPTVLSATRIAAHWTSGASAGESCAATPTGTYATAVKADSPSLYYRLGDRSSSRVAYDSSGNCRNGTYNVASTTSAGALAGDANQSVGLTNDVALVGPSSGLPTGSSARSAEGWVKTLGGDTKLLSYGAANMFGVRISNASTKTIVVYNGTSQVTFDVPFDFGDSNWHYWAVTFSSGTVSFYGDGQLVGTAALAINSDTLTGLTMGDVRDPKFDELAVYPTILSAARIAAHWTAGASTGTSCASTPTGTYATAIKADQPAAYYRLGDRTGSRVAYDSSGNCRNGSYAVPANSVSSGIAGDSNQAVALYNDVALAGPVTGLPTGTAVRSADGWVKNVAGDTKLLSYGGANRFEVRVSNYDSRVLVVSNGPSIVTFEVPFDFLDNTWHYWAVTFNGSSVSMYGDGQLAGTQTLAINSDQLKGLTMGDVRDPQFDELAVYPSVLSPARVAAHWTAGASTDSACRSAGNSVYANFIRAERPAAYYRLGERPNGRVAYDASTNCRNGAYGVGALSVAGAIAGDSNAAIYGNGIRAAAGSVASLPTGSADRTADGWVKDVGGDTVLVSYGKINQFEVRISNYSTSVLVVSNGINQVVFSTTTNFQDGLWHHWAVSASNGSVTLYADGMPVGTTALAMNSDAMKALSFGVSGAPSFDELAIYSSALPASHIALHYALGRTSGLAGGPVTAREILANANLCVGCVMQQLAAPTQGPKADPILPSTGAFVEQFGDISISGRGFPLGNMRSYSSAVSTDNGPFGYGWKGSYDAHLNINATSGDVTVVQENGSETPFVNASGTFTTAPRFNATLTLNAGVYTLSRNQNDTLTFNNAGQLISLSDRNGITTTLSYVGGKLSQVTSVEGRHLSYTWTGTRITKIQDDTGRHVDFAYDANGDLGTVTDLNGGVMRFTYDSSHRILTVLDPKQNGSSSPQPVRNVYDTSGRVTSQTDQLGRQTTFTYNTDSTLTTDPSGNKVLDTYWQGLRIAETAGYGTAQATTTHFAYDPTTATLIGTYVEAPNDPNDHAVTMTYDAAGRLATQTDGMGRTSSFTYNANGDLLTSTAPNPSTTGPATVTSTNTYDAAGNLLTTASPLYTTATAYTDQTITYQRTVTGKADLVSAVVDPLSKTTTNVYNGLGQLTSQTSPDGRKTSYTYDTLGRVATTVAPKGNVSGATAANFTTTYTYDLLDRVTNTSTANGTTPVLSATTYDLNGNVSGTTDGDGRQTTYNYDLAGQQTSVLRPNSTTLSSTFFPNGVLATQVDGNLKATTYIQDSLGRVASVKDPLNRTTSYTYDGTGAVLTVTDPLNKVTANAYDNAGALKTTSYSDGVTAGITATTYNDAGAKTATTDGTGTQTYAYDSLGRLTAHVNGASKTVNYGYNVRNELTSIAYPGRGTVTRTFGNDGQLASVADWSANTTTFGYDQNMALTTVTSPNGVVGTTTYDNAGRSTNMAYVKSGATLANYAYGRTAGGDLSAETDTGTATGTNKTYAYNTLGQLSSENGSSLTYDAADNLTRLTSGATMAYDNANEVTSRTSGSTTTTFGYDLKGNRTTSVTGGTTTTLAYDQANRLKSYGSSTYKYDGGGIRTSKTVGGTTKAFIYDVAEGLPLILDDTTNAYIYGPGGMAIEQVTGTTKNYLHQDQLGSTRLITNAAGAAVGNYQFDAYGNGTYSGTVASPIRYAGQYQDDESALYWMRARYYDPGTGQFLARDPLSGVTLSVYGYVDGSPLNVTDPTGMISWKTIGAIAVGAAYVGAVACTLSVACGLAVVGAIGVVSAASGAAILGGAAGLGRAGTVARAVGAAPAVTKSSTAGPAAKECASVPSIIYRAGGKTPENFTPRAVDQGALSFRSSISNPVGSGQTPVFRPGVNVHGIDTSKLPNGSVVVDNNPAGHVSVSGVDPATLLNSIVSTQKMPKK